MLERASTCLETGGRQLLRSRQRCLRSRRMLHATFWHNAASELSLPAWWTSSLMWDRTNGDVEESGDRGQCSKDSQKQDGLLLDFLYPEKTLALMQRISTSGRDTMEMGRRHQLNRGGARQFSTTPWQASRVNTDVLDPIEVALQAEVEHRLTGSSASEALRDLITSSEEGKQELAWRLYVASPEWGPTPDLQAALLDYLASSGANVDANRLIQLFDALPTETRRASSYSAAISAYLSLAMVGPAVQLHEEAATRELGPDIGTDILLGRTVRDNQWDLSLRVLHPFSRYAMRNHLDISERFVLVNGKKRQVKDVWGSLGTLPYLRGNLESFLLHVKQFRHELRSSQEKRRTLKHFLFGLAAETMEQVLHTEPVDEDLIWNFFGGFFRQLRTLELPSSDLYEYAIMRMLETPRYQQYTNQRKTHLELYRLYREGCMLAKDPNHRPSRWLLRNLMSHVATLRSTAAVENIITDYRTFYPVDSMPSSMLKILIDYYAESGEVDKVRDYFNQLRKEYPSSLDLRVLLALPYSYARRVDVEGAEKQFQRISDEFEIKPDTACWNVLLLAYTRADDLDGALACFDRMLEAGAYPDNLTFGPLLDLCAARGDVEAFEALYSKAEQLKIPLRTDMRARAGYVQALLQFGDADGAEATALSMLKNRRAGILHGSLTHTWNMLIQHYAILGDITSGRRLYKQMIEYNIPLDSWTYASLMRALVEVKQTNAAYKILRVTMPSQNVQVHAFHYAMCIIGFLREKQYAHALRVNKRMLDRNLPQTPTSRLATLQVTGVTELRRLEEGKKEDPRQRLIATEEALREILFSDYESDVANRQPRMMQTPDSRGHSTLEGYFGLLILLYGTRKAFDICKELSEAAVIARADKDKYEVPINLLTAIMEVHLRAKEYKEVAKCWDLAREQAEKLVKTFGQIKSPSPPKVEFDSIIDPSIREAAETAKIAVNRRQILVRAARIYIRSLIYSHDRDGLQQAQRTIRSLLTSGFVLDNLTWNEFIQMLARRGHIIDAFSACEAYLMPAFPGWRTLSPYYSRTNQQGHYWMELRHTDLTKRSLMPRYKTLVVLAAAYAQVRMDEANGMGYKPEMGGWAREVLEQMSPMTVRAIESMPRTGDKLQRRFLSGML